MQGDAFGGGRDEVFGLPEAGQTCIGGYVRCDAYHRGCCKSTIDSEPDV